MNWIQTKVPDLPITNFTTDWNSGKAVGALVDAVAPGLCPDWEVYIFFLKKFCLAFHSFLFCIIRIGIQKIPFKMHRKRWVWLTIG